MSELVEFYKGNKPLKDGTFIHDILEWEDEKLEQCHDYIQWVFPLTEPSEFNPDAPIFTYEDSVAFVEDEDIYENVQPVFERMMDFYGFTYGIDNELCLKDFKHTFWWHPKNHNMRRLTRIIKSLRLMGFENLSEALFQILMTLFEKMEGFEEPVMYWKDAFRRYIMFYKYQNPEGRIKEKLPENVLTVADLWNAFRDFSNEETPVGVTLNGQFSYLTKVEPVISSTWDTDRLYVLPVAEKDNTEYPVEEGLRNGDLVYSLWLGKD